MKQKATIKKLLNYCYLNYTNKTVSCGKKDLPALYCNTCIYPDFLALSSETHLYKKTGRTCICFYEYDSDFDGKNGLFESIYYDDQNRLTYYKKKYAGVKFVISPDYSEFGDVHLIENEYRLFKARVVALWFVFEIGAIVIPNISFPSEESASFALHGYEDCSVVAISTKSHMQNKAEYERLRWKIRFTVDTLNLKAIVVYDVCSSNEKAIECFAYAVSKGVEIIIPDNTLKARNRDRMVMRNG